MKTAGEWFSEYSAYHQNATNRRIHMVAVPAIMLSLMALLWQVKLPVPGLGWPAWSNLGVALIAGGIYFYTTMRSRLVLGMMCIASLLFLGIILWMESSGLSGLQLSLLWTAVFVLAWIAQFIGHSRFEHKKPSFFNDLLFLFVGPPWVFAEVLGLKVE